MRSHEELLALAEEGVKLALARGADAAETYVSASRTTRLFAAGRTFTPSQNADLALGVRVLAGGRLGISGASRPEGLAAAIDQALASVKDIAGASEVREFPRPAADPAPRASIDPRLREERAGDLSRLAETIMEAALATRGVTYTQLTLVSSIKRIALANSAGHAAWDETAVERAELEVRCTRGTTHRGGADGAASGKPIDTVLDGARFASTLTARVASALDTAPLDRPVDEVVLLPQALAQMVRMVAPSLCARVTPQGVHAPAGAIGDAIYAPGIHLADEPRGPAGNRYRNVDDEGVPTRATKLVADGRLVAMLHDTRTAARGSAASTGNGMRSSAASSIAPAPINLALKPGALDLAALMDAERAVLVTEPLLGGFTHNKSTGDFSIVVPFAFLVERGRVVHALPPTTVGGNAHRVLREVRALGMERSATGAPLAAVRAGGVSCAT